MLFAAIPLAEPYSDIKAGSVFSRLRTDKNEIGFKCSQINQFKMILATGTRYLS